MSFKHSHLLLFLKYQNQRSKMMSDQCCQFYSKSILQLLSVSMAAPLSTSCSHSSIFRSVYSNPKGPQRVGWRNSWNVTQLLSPYIYSRFYFIVNLGERFFNNLVRKQREKKSVLKILQALSALHLLVHLNQSLYFCIPEWNISATKPLIPQHRWERFKFTLAFVHLCLIV